eukprot:TRINITY_DN16685_c0_g1_i4.p2 TRINITY_DN16685_c0_g1~~TRINITY_DN16685_c0_g1_i4.p2  ORF type:complete len:464 (+),score=105.97 TRINITY_DN16685_c0_g1_i4:77-1393(+)
MKLLILVTSAVTFAAGLEASLDGEAIEVDLQDEDDDEEDDLAADYNTYLAERGVRVDGVKVKVDGENGLMVVAERDLEAGHTIASATRKSLQVRTRHARKKAKSVIKENDNLKDMQEQVLLAVKLMDTEGALHYLSQENYPTSGLNVSESTMKCLYGDIVSHIHLLRETVTKFTSTIVQMGLNTHENAERAMLYTLQSGGNLPGTKEMVVFPLIDIMDGDIFGQVEPGEFTAEGMTLVINKKVKKGERLAKVPRITLFRSAALFGQIDDELDGVPIELSWHSLPATAKAKLVEHGCGTGTVGMIKSDGYSDLLLKCVSIAAAYQIEHEEADTTDYSDPLTFAPDITLAGYDLLNSLIQAHIDKIPKDEECYKQNSIPVLVNMNQKIRKLLKSAGTKLKDLADSYIQVLEKNGFVPAGVLEKAAGIEEDDDIDDKTEEL